MEMPWAQVRVSKPLVKSGHGGGGAGGGGAFECALSDRLELKPAEGEVDARSTASSPGRSQHLRHIGMYQE